MKIIFAILLLPAVFGIKHNCPGVTFQCDDSATCCQLLDKSYGCCPLKDAICCDDHIHCCPANTKCSTGMCIQQNLKLTNTSAYIVKAKDVTCPGGKFTCPDETTCCPGERPHSFGCCPMEDAVCCSDKVHCCPSGTTCNLSAQTCDGDNFVSAMYDSSKKLFKSHISNVVQLERIDVEEVSSVICPDSSFSCPGEYTCCKLKSGEWGCCPFPSASCCKDGYHCCPEDMQCDETSAFCRQGLNNITSTRNVPATKITAKNIICPDKSSCLDSMTCCAISETKFGCCQYPNATCCSDKLHCCPSGNKCDVVAKRCIPEDHWLLNMI